MVCPLVDRNEDRCACNLTIENLEMALAICGDAFTECPYYKELQREADEQLAQAARV